MPRESRMVVLGQSVPNFSLASVRGDYVSLDDFVGAPRAPGGIPVQSLSLRTTHRGEVGQCPGRTSGSRRRGRL